MRKEIKFSVFQLIVDDQEFTMDTFADISDQVTDASTRHHSNTGETEVTAVLRVNKKEYENRFICFYFNTGDKFPYSPTVVKSDFEEYRNPRSADEFELKEQLFVLLDVVKQRVYLSDQRQKNNFRTWIGGQINKTVFLKSIIDEHDFVSAIKSISSIKFTVVPTLLSSARGSILSESLVQDIFGFDAEKARLELIYNNKNITQGILDKLRAIIGQPGGFEELVVIGRDEEDFEATFNMEKVVNKLPVIAEADEQSEMFDPENVFEILIGDVKLHD